MPVILPRRCFNPRAREGRDAGWLCEGLGYWLFQSTRPRGARRGHAELFNIARGVSIHAPARGATIDTELTYGLQLVSIHAPARGATRTTNSIPYGNVFQSTRPRGARLCGWWTGTSTTSFNPRAREGRDAPWKTQHWQENQFQSTRPRGARPSCLASTAPSSQFQSTRPRGARLMATWKPKLIPRFQSTRPRGARPLSMPATCCRSLEFQSTRPRGARREFAEYKDKGSGFQSTRPRGARRLLSPCNRARLLVSIHAPARGATTGAPGFPQHGISFNPRAREGRDVCSAMAVTPEIKFQSTRPRGARPYRAAIRIKRKGFQSTRPRGARRTPRKLKP